MQPRPISSDLLRFPAARLPYKQAALRDRDRPVEQQGKSGEHQDPGEHGIDVKGSFGLQDDVADALGGPEILAHYRANERKTHRIVEAGEDPAHCAWDVYMAHQLAIRCTQNSRVGENGVAHFPY